MAWPPTSGVSTGYAADSTVTTIRWGTDGLTPSGLTGSYYYVCTKFSQKERTEVIKLPQGSGLTANRIYVKAGYQWSVTVRDESGWSPPSVGTSVYVVDAAGMIQTTRKKYNAKVVSNDYEAAVKQPGERVLVLESLTLIEGIAAGVAATGVSQT